MFGPSTHYDVLSKVFYHPSTLFQSKIQRSIKKWGTIFEPLIIMDKSRFCNSFNLLGDNIPFDMQLPFEVLIVPKDVNTNTIQEIDCF